MLLISSRRVFRQLGQIGNACGDMTGKPFSQMKQIIPNSGFIAVAILLSTAFAKIFPHFFTFGCTVAVGNFAAMRTCIYKRTHLIILFYFVA